MDIKIANDEPYQLIKFESIKHKNFNNSLDNAYLEFMKSGHQLLRYCLYPKSKKIGRYATVSKIPTDAEIIDDLHEI